MAIYKNENGTMVKYAGGGGSTGSSGASVVISSTEPTDQNVGDLWLVIDGDDGTVDDETGGAYEEAGLYDDDGIMLMSWDDLSTEAYKYNSWTISRIGDSSQCKLNDYLTNNGLFGTLVLPNTVSTIGFFAFNGCSTLHKIIISSSIENIQSHAFENCTGLTEMTIPNTVTNVGEFIFYGCDNLTTIYYNSACASMGGNAFLRKGCANHIIFW